MSDAARMFSRRVGATTFVGTGEAAPHASQMVDNEGVLEDLRSAGFDTGDKTGESTEKLVGIRTRWITPIEVSAYDLALEAAQNAVSMAKAYDPDFRVDRIRLIHSGGSTPDMIHPAIATRIQHKIGVPVGDCEGRDIMLACTSGVDALVLADSRLRDICVQDAAVGLDPAPIYAIVSLGETIGSQANPPLNLDHTLWGCGAGSVVLKYDPYGDPEVGVLATKSLCDGERADWTESIGVGHRPDYVGRPPHASMGSHAKDIHRYALREIPKHMRRFLDNQRFDATSPRAAFLPHNSNLSMQLGIAKELGFDPERVFTRIRDRGNTSSASILLSMDFHNRQGCFETGDRLFLAAFGGGMSMSFVDYRWA